MRVLTHPSSSTLRGAGIAFLPLVALIALALGVPALSVGFDAIGEAWTAIYFDSGLFRAFCL